MDTSHWQHILRTNFTTLADLVQFLEISSDADLLPHPNFPINVPRRLAEKMAKGKIGDPIFRQFVPLREELEIEEGFCIDPVHDTHFQKSESVLQKYNSRALVITTSVCAMHCRFCFRQNYPYSKEVCKNTLPVLIERERADTTSCDAAVAVATTKEQSAVYVDRSRSKQTMYSCTLPKASEYDLSHVKETSSIDELILSGGDPLSLSNRMLQCLFDDIAAIPHIKRIRIHTRFPIGIPERIDEAFCGILAGSHQQVIFVLHVNHKNEFDDVIVSAIKEIQRLGIPVLSQTVLLSGVNDTVDALASLMRTLGNMGIIPYYLHQLDRVRGAHHFEVPIERGKALVEQLHRELSGYLVPKYVQEIPGAHGKHYIFSGT